MNLRPEREFKEGYFFVYFGTLLLFYEFPTAPMTLEGGFLKNMRVCQLDKVFFSRLRITPFFYKHQVNLCQPQICLEILGIEP